MKRIIFVLVIILTFLFSLPVLASINLNIDSEEILNIVEIIFKANFCGDYKSKGYDINYENYEFDEIIYHEKNKEWEVRYTLTDRGFYNIFGWVSNRNHVWSEEWVSYVSFFVSKNTCEIKTLRIGHIVSFVPESNTKLISNAEVAIEVADIICRAVFSEVDFQLYSPYSTYDFENDEWEIGYLPKDQKDKLTLGGGSPEIHMKRSTGEITYIELSM